MPRHEGSSAEMLDEHRLRVISDAHGAQLLRYLERLTGDRHLAEDMLQETWLRAWRELRGCHEVPAHASPNGAPRPLNGAPRPWLFRVARNLAVDLHRARRARPREVSFEPAIQLPAVDRADRSMLVGQIICGLRALRREHRVVVIEVCFRGRSIGETAGLLGIPAGTVKSRCHYGLRALRAELQRRGAHPTEAGMSI